MAASILPSSTAPAWERLLQAMERAMAAALGSSGQPTAPSPALATSMSWV